MINSNRIIHLKILNEDALPNTWEGAVILHSKERAFLCTTSPSQKYMTCQFRDVVACFSIHSVLDEKYNCSFVGLATNPYEWGGYHETRWYEEYGFLKVVFEDIVAFSFTTKRIYFDKALYYLQKERMNGKS